MNWGMQASENPVGFESSQPKVAYREQIVNDSEKYGAKLNFLRKIVKTDLPGMGRSVFDQATSKNYFLMIWAADFVPGNL